MKEGLVRFRKRLDFAKATGVTLAIVRKARDIFWEHNWSCLTFEEGFLTAQRWRGDGRGIG